MTAARESTTLFCSQRMKVGPNNGQHCASPNAPSPSCARCCPTSPSAPWRRSSTTSRATPTRSPARWARPSGTAVETRARRLRHAGCALGGRRSRSRPPRPSTAPTSSAAARRAAAARSTRCSRRTGSAPGSPGASCPRRRCAPASTPARWRRFAELVFAYIDQLSAASVAGHTDELATTGRVRQRLLERLAAAAARRLVARGGRRSVAERADWTPPRTLTAVVVPESQVRAVLGSVSPGDAPGDRGTPAVAEDHVAAAGAGRPRTSPGGAAARPRRPRRGRRSGATVAAGQGVLRAGPAGARARARAPTPRSTSPSWCSAPTPARSPTCVPGCSRPLDELARLQRREARPRRCAPGCSTTAAATRWRPSCSCTRRPCATGWASCARSSATGSRTPAASSS